MDIITLALAKKYTKDTANQFGAVKGANAKIYSETKDSNGNSVITFEWKNDADENKYTSVTVSKGVDVKSAQINDLKHLIITLSDNTEVDAGELDADSTLQEDLIATVAIGTITTGKKYNKGTPIENILRDMLIKVENPICSISLQPSNTVYDVVSDELSAVTIKCNVTKKTYEVKKLEIYCDGVLIHTVTSGISSGGPVNYEYIPDLPIKATCIFKAVVTDVEGGKSENSLKVSFVGNSYYGYVEPETGAPNETLIKALNKKLKITKSFVYEDANYDYNKMVYAYPAEFGALSSIKDLENNINYTNSFTKTTLKVDGIDYYCYTQNTASKAAGINVTFA